MASFKAFLVPVSYCLSIIYCTAVCILLFILEFLLCLLILFISFINPLIINLLNILSLIFNKPNKNFNVYTGSNKFFALNIKRQLTVFLRI